ncbi:hypothetical protein HHI36_014273 [Cryptolaemus montrouzieri]|uniref:Uncharacterized protein n=1 Tax=Cryptolaemus montrouzieri TaxID=559131 RepID=A0ABD2N2L0_9CUCU
MYKHSSKNSTHLKQSSWLVPPRRPKHLTQKQAQVQPLENNSVHQTISQKSEAGLPQGYIHDHYSPKLDRFKFGKSKSFDVFTENTKNQLNIQDKRRSVFVNPHLRKGQERLSSSSNESVRKIETNQYKANKDLCKRTVKNDSVINVDNSVLNKSDCTKANITKEKLQKDINKTGEYLKEHRIKSKYSPPPELSYTEAKLSAESTNDLETNNKNNKKLLNFECDKSLVGYLTALNMFRAGLKLKERFVLGLSVVAVLFTLLLVIDIQMDYGYSGAYIVPSHGRVRYVQKEDGPQAAYNSFRKRFLQKTHSGSVNISKEAVPLEQKQSENLIQSSQKIKDNIVTEEHDDFSDLLDYILLDDYDREKFRTGVGRESPVLQKDFYGELVRTKNPSIAELKHIDLERTCSAEKTVKDAQKSANIGNIEELYNTTRLLVDKQFRSKKLIKDKHGNPLVNAIDQLRRWQEYFRELFQNEILDGVDQPTDEDEDVPEDSKISSNPPTKSEIMQAIMEHLNVQQQKYQEVIGRKLKAIENFEAIELNEMCSTLTEAIHTATKVICSKTKNDKTCKISVATNVFMDKRWKWPRALLNTMNLATPSEKKSEKTLENKMM